MNEAGPRDEPWMTLAIMLANEDVSAPNFVQKKNICTSVEMKVWTTEVNINNNDFSNPLSPMRNLPQSTA